MDENDREKFEVQANEVKLNFQIVKQTLQDKKRYETEMASYVPADGWGVEMSFKSFLP